MAGGSRRAPQATPSHAERGPPLRRRRALALRPGGVAGAAGRAPVASGCPKPGRPSHPGPAARSPSSTNARTRAGNPSVSSTEEAGQGKANDPVRGVAAGLLIRTMPSSYRTFSSARALDFPVSGVLFGSDMACQNRCRSHRTSCYIASYIMSMHMNAIFAGLLAARTEAPSSTPARWVRGGRGSCWGRTATGLTPRYRQIGPGRRPGVHGVGVTRRPVKGSLPQGMGTQAPRNHPRALWRRTGWPSPQGRGPLHAPTP